MKGEAPEPDQKDKPDQQIVVSAAFLARAEKEEREPGERGKQESAVARGVHGLGEQRFVRSALAVEEDMLAQCHGRYPFDSSVDPIPAGPKH
jgi:hypothetical protein